MGTRQIYGYELRENKIKSSLTDTWHPTGEKAFSGVMTTISSGGPIPKWRQRLRNCIQATTPLDISGSIITCRNDGLAYCKSRFATLIDYQAAKGTLSFLDHVPPDPAAYVIQSVDSQVRMNIIAKIRQAQTQMKGLISLGELGETVRMVNSAGQAVNRGLWSYLDEVSKRARRGQITPNHMLRWIGSRWLEYAFGIKPLIADIDDGINAFVKLYVGRPPVVFVRASAQSSESNPMTAVDTNIARHAVKLTPMRRNFYSSRIYGAVSISNQGVGAGAHAFGIKLDEFVPTLYELIPFSFLADYFVNLGAVIDALSFNSSVIRWLNIGKMRSSELEVIPSVGAYSLTSPPWMKEDVSIDLGTPFKFVRFAKSRNGFSNYSDLVPSLQFKVPGVSTRWVNMAALGTQALNVSRQVRSLRI